MKFGVMDQLEGNYEESVKLMDRAADIANSGDMSSALSLFVEACELSPQNIKAQVNTVQCLVYLERFDEAKPYIDEAERNIDIAGREIGIDERSRKRLQEFKALIYTYKGMCLYSDRSFDEALVWINKALAIEPKKRDALQMKKACISAKR